MTFAIAAPRVFDGTGWHDNAALLIESGDVADIAPVGNLPDDLETVRIAAGFIAPGFVDLQVNGGGGALLNACPNAASIESIVQGHRASGTTGMFPTVISDTPDVSRKAVLAVEEARKAGIKEVLGLHLEGPFFAASKRGTHRADRLRAPISDDIEWLKSAAAYPLMLTVAPEVMEFEHIAALKEAGIIVSAGHTNAPYATVKGAIDAGVSCFTHLFNAMSPLTSREPGAVGAALCSDSTFAGVIADGHHVHAATLRIAWELLGSDRLFLVSDAMATVGSKDKTFRLYDELICESDGKLVNAEGSLAGSAIGMIDAVKFMHEDVGVPLIDALKMSSRTPAQVVGLGAYVGSLRPGYRADVVALDETLRVSNVWCAGQLTYGGKDSKQTKQVETRQ